MNLPSSFGVKYLRAGYCNRIVTSFVAALFVSQTCSKEYLRPSGNSFRPRIADECLLPEVVPEGLRLMQDLLAETGGQIRQAAKAVSGISGGKPREGAALDVGGRNTLDFLIDGGLYGIGRPLQVICVRITRPLVLVQVCHLKMVGPLTRPAQQHKGLYFGSEV